MMLWEAVASLLKPRRMVTRPTWVLALGPALSHAPEVVGIAEAAAVEEAPALLRVAVKHVAGDQASAGARGLGQVARVLVRWRRGRSAL